MRHLREYWPAWLLGTLWVGLVVVCFTLILNSDNPEQNAAAFGTGVAVGMVLSK